MRRSKTMSGWQALVGLWLVLTGASMAHPILQNPMWVEVAPDMLKVKIYVSIRELNVVQGLPIAGDGAVDTALAGETAPRHSGYVLDHLNFRADGNPLSGTVTSIEPPKEVGKGMEGPDRAHFVYRLEYPLAQPPAQIALSHTMVQEFPSAPGVPWDLSYTYRFGPPGATPVEFGSITRDVLVTYKTGFAQPAGTIIQASTAGPHWPLLTAFGLLGAALGLGTGNRLDRLRLLGAVTISCLIGWGTAATFGIRMPLFLVTALGGIGILLVSVDNIHRPLVPMDLRRWIMAGFFPAAAGFGAERLSMGKHFLWAQGLALLVGAALVASTLAQRVPAPPVNDGQAPRHPFVQLVSLLICAGGLVVLLEGLGIRPWSYWLNRLTS